MQEVPALRLHGPGVRAELSADRDGECFLEITQVEPAAGSWRLEVIWQPVDERGLARGFTSPLYETPLEFTTHLDAQSRAYVQLPANISFELARKCYYRVERRAAPRSAPA
jgi:hypothetical protein